MKFPTVAELRNRLVFESESLSDDGQGGTTPSWSATATVWGKLEPLSANQINFAASLGQRVSHRVCVREGAVTGLSTAMRISFESRIFHVQSFRDIGERDRFVEIMAMEGAAS